MEVISFTCFITCSNVSTSFIVKNLDRNGYNLIFCYLQYGCGSNTYNNNNNSKRLCIWCGNQNLLQHEGFYNEFRVCSNVFSFVNFMHHKCFHKFSSVLIFITKGNYDIYEGKRSDGCFWDW